MRAIALLALVAPLLAGAQLARAPERLQETGVSGVVLTPDGVPVASGTVTFRDRSTEASATIGRDGRFRIVPHAAGPHELHVDAAGLAPYQLRVTVPVSRTLMLPPIRLSPPTHFRVRFVSRAGEPIVSPRIVRTGLEMNRAPMAAPPASRPPDGIVPDGTATIGPLPRGITRIALDTPPFARMRLPDVRVTGATTLIDGGTVVVDPGARLEVEVVDAAGSPVPGHDVFLEDTVPLSPLSFPLMRTDRKGHVAFDRLAAGRYRLYTRSEGLCGNQYLSIAREVPVGGSGSVRTRLVIGGTASVRLTSGGVALTATSLLAWPGSGPGPQNLPFWLRGRFGSPCPGVTDADGRATLANFPPGPARIDVRLPNSTWIRRVTVPPQRRDIAIEIPGGYFPLRVSGAATGDPVPGASITWLSAGLRIEATTSVSGEALLDGVAAAPGILTVEARGYESTKAKLLEPPGVLHDVTLVPTRGVTFECRVVTESGEPLPEAVVELLPGNAMETGQVMTTNAMGLATFVEPPKGRLRLMARADRYAVSWIDVPAGAATAASVTLARGYRVVVGVEPSPDEQPFMIDIRNEAGASMAHLLDAASDFVISAPRPVSLGPLPPGLYIVEMHRANEERERVPVEVIDRDVDVTFRGARR